MNLRDFLYHLAHDYPGGASELEVRTGAGKNYIQNGVAPSLADSHHLNARVLEKMLDFIPNGNMEAAKFFALKAHATVIPIPTSLGNVGDMELLDGFLNVTRELGEFSGEFQKSWADGRITSKEFELLKIQWHEMVAAGQLFMERVGSLVQESPNKLKVVK
jgi:hypothetical protein